MYGGEGEVRGREREEVEAGGRGGASWARSSCVRIPGKMKEESYKTKEGEIRGEVK